MALHDPFDANTKLDSCTCGKHALNSRVIETTVMRALFPQDGERRKFLSTVGASTAWAAISSLIPFGALEAMAQEKGSLEKKDLKVGFIPITCASR
jgi:nitrate/nitrite transport system substrate-binding protein